MNRDLLKKIMAEKGITTKFMAKKTGIFMPVLYWKLKGRAEFTLSEIASIAKALNLSEHTIYQIFFATKVS